NLRVGANWRSVLGPLGRAVLMHRRGGAAAAATTSCRHYAAASCSGSGARGGTAGGSGQSTITKAELDAAAAAVVEAYHLCPNFEILVPALLEGGVEGLRTRCVLTPGIPIKPMLAKICDGMEDGLRQLGPGAPFLVEYKYDGVRAQIHMQPDGRVFIFSRNCEDRTDSYPDVCALIRSAAVQPRTQSSEHRADRATADLKPVRSPTPATTSCILDAEVVALEWLGHEEDLMHGGPLRAMEVEMEEDAAREDRPSAGGTACGDSSAAGERNASAAASDTSAAPYRLRAFQELATRARRQVEEHQVERRGFRGVGLRQFIGRHSQPPVAPGYLRVLISAFSAFASIRYSTIAPPPFPSGDRASVCLRVRLAVLERAAASPQVGRKCVSSWSWERIR
ncbi:hypothetical protein Vafri_21003, partial [Volvox africanus]